MARTRSRIRHSRTFLARACTLPETPLDTCPGAPSCPRAAGRAPPVPWRRAAHGVLAEDARAVRRRVRGQRCQGLCAGRSGRPDGGPGPGRGNRAENDLARCVRGLRDTRGIALTPFLAVGVRPCPAPVSGVRRAAAALAHGRVAAVAGPARGFLPKLCVSCL